MTLGVQFSDMKRFLALTAIFVFVLSGIRAPETSVRTSGYCFSGPVLEKIVTQDSFATEWRSAPANPVTIHSGFAPSFHPFDLPVYVDRISVLYVSRLFSDFVLPIDQGFSFPAFRPPALLSV